MRVAAIDLGKARIGLAVSDELGMLAHPRPFLDGRNLQGTLAALLELVREEGITTMLVGLPRNLNGSEGPSARRARQFAELVRKATGCTVELVDEWLTTKEAQARLHAQGLDTRASRARIDSASAAVILQAWLDGRGQSAKRRFERTPSSEDESASRKPQS